MGPPQRSRRHPTVGGSAPKSSRSGDDAPPTGVATRSLGDLRVTGSSQERSLAGRLIERGRSVCERLLRFAGAVVDVVDEDVPGRWIGPPPAERRMEDQADEDAMARMQSMVVTLPSVRRTGLPGVLPALAFPLANANMTAAVTAVHTMPSRLWWAW